MGGGVMWGISLDRAFRRLYSKLGNWGGGDWLGMSIFVIGGRELPHELACLCIEFGFFALEIAEAAEELRNARDEI